MKTFKVGKTQFRVDGDRLLYSYRSGQRFRLYNTKGEDVVECLRNVAQSEEMCAEAYRGHAADHDANAAQAWAAIMALEAGEGEG